MAKNTDMTNLSGAMLWKWTPLGFDQYFLFFENVLWYGYSCKKNWMCYIIGAIFIAAAILVLYVVFYSYNLDVHQRVWLTIF